MSTVQEVKTCSICKETKTIDNFNYIPHTAELQKNCHHCNAHKSSHKKRGRQQERVSKFLNGVIPLSQFLNMLALADGAEVFRNDCPPETIIQGDILLPPKDFSPHPRTTHITNACGGPKCK
jgi:hypothetical protein